MGIGRVSALAAACAMLFALATAQAASADTVDWQLCPDWSIRPSSANAQQAVASVYCLINAARINNGVPALRWNTQLASAAGQMAGLMVSEQFYSHQTPSGQTLATRVAATGYIPTVGGWSLAENLAWGEGAYSTPEEIVDGWMGSPEHRANVLDPRMQDIGIGMAPGSPLAGYNDGAVFVADFGVTQPATESDQFAVGSTRSLQIARERKVRHLRKACMQRRGEFWKMTRARTRWTRTRERRTCLRRSHRLATIASSARTCCVR